MISLALPTFDTVADPAWSRRFPGHDDRLREHAARVAAGLSRATDPPSHCWACGCAAPAANAKEARREWHTRPIALAYGPVQLETYCPACFEEWGWPDGA